MIIERNELSPGYWQIAVLEGASQVIYYVIGDEGAARRACHRTANALRALLAEAEKTKEDSEA